MPVVRTDGRTYGQVITKNFSDGCVTTYFLSIGLHSHPRRARVELRHQFDSFKREELFVKKTCAFGILRCCERKKKTRWGRKSEAGCGGNFLAMGDCLQVLSK